MEVTLTKRELRDIKLALYLAEQSEDAMEESFRCAYDKRTVRGRTVIPPEWRKQARTARRNAETFKKIRLKLRDILK